MKYKILLPLLVSVALLNACSKDKNEVTLPGDTILETYYPGDAMEIKEIAIYTNNTVITDPAFIQDYMDRNLNEDLKKSFFLGMSSIPVPASNNLLHFLNDNRVNVNGTNMQIMGYKDSLMLVSEYTSTPIPNSVSSCVTLANQVAEFNPFTDCPDGNCGSYRKVTPLIVNGASYYAPLLTYVAKTENCVTAASEIPAINVKNHNLQSILAEEDSVLIQFAKLPLLKKAKE
jgi:hypothetical protein